MLNVYLLNQHIDAMIRTELDWDDRWGNTSLDRRLLFGGIWQYVGLRAGRGFDLNSDMIWISGAYWTGGTQ